jgi:hypothetical protein
MAIRLGIAHATPASFRLADAACPSPFGRDTLPSTPLILTGIHFLHFPITHISPFQADNFIIIKTIWHWPKKFLYI